MIYISDISKYNDVSKLKDNLPLEFVNHCLKHKNEEDIKRSLIAWTILFNHLKQNNIFDFNIKYNIYNKPFLEGINFNISHSKEKIAVAVSSSSSSKIGVDIEDMIERDFSLLSKRFFSIKEKEKIEHDKDNKFLFYSIWTQRESYYKYLGSGINLDKPITELDEKLLYTIYIEDSCLSLCTDTIEDKIIVV